MRLLGHAPAPATSHQLKSVIRRLEVVLGEALEGGRRVGVEVTPAKLALLCDELLIEAEQPGYRPANDGTVEAFFFGGLFEEMVQQPSNIFEEVTSPEGKSFYVPLTVETWTECLRTLRTLLTPSQ